MAKKAVRQKQQPLDPDTPPKEEEMVIVEKRMMCPRCKRPLERGHTDRAKRYYYCNIDTEPPGCGYSIQVDRPEISVLLRSGQRKLNVVARDYLEDQE